MAMQLQSFSNACPLLNAEKNVFKLIIFFHVSSMKSNFPSTSRYYQYYQYHRKRHRVLWVAIKAFIIKINNDLDLGVIQSFMFRACKPAHYSGRSKIYISNLAPSHCILTPYHHGHRNQGRPFLAPDQACSCSSTPRFAVCLGGNCRQFKEKT